MAISDPWGCYGKSAQKTKGKSVHPETRPTKAEQLWVGFRNLAHEDSPKNVSNEQQVSVNGNHSPFLTTTPSLIYHAEIYMFAQKYLIHNLRTLSLRELHAELLQFHLTPKTTEDILEMLEFTYPHRERTESGDDDLRVLIVHYVACETEILKPNPKFRVLLEQYGEMACDLFYKD
jgi:hypothetical protein